MDHSSAAAVKATFEQWELYLAIIRNNYMRHDELTQRLNVWLHRRPTPVTILDLGSGDGYMAYEALRGVEVAEYHAIDLSDEALRRLVAGTPAWEGRRTVHRGNFFDCLPALADAHFDVVLGSYSLHHLSGEETDRVLAQIARVLKPHGGFVWTDCVRNENEGRDAYMDRLETAIRTCWSQLTTEQQNQTIEHMWSRDFPLPLSGMASAAAAHGLSERDLLFRDEFFGSWEFRRSVTA